MQRLAGLCALVVFAAIAPLHAAPCAVTEEIRTVRGNSLFPVLQHGQDITIELGYYACHPVQRDDLVVFRHAGTQTLIKFAKGLPGERLALQPAPDGLSEVLVNDQVVTNAQHEPYRLTSQGAKMLSLYIRDYHGTIPPQAYLVFGNLPHGSRDSSAFGLIGESALLGRATVPSPQR